MNLTESSDPTSPEASAPEAWPSWSAWAAELGLAPDEPLLLALSGGADSMLLLEVLATASPRPPIFALHFDHQLRGAESSADAEFCRTRCRELGVPLRVARGELAPGSPGLEERARRARYRSLAEEAERLGLRRILTAHHRDDRLETLVQRWVRGDVLFGLTGPSQRRTLAPGSELNPTHRELELLRPMLALDRTGIRRLLRESGRAWREDSSNRDPAFTRNRIRGEVLPELFGEPSERAHEQLVRFEHALDSLETTIASATAELDWKPQAIGTPRHLSRSAFAALAPTLRPLALWRLLARATGRGPGQRLLALLCADLDAHRSARHQLPSGWSLHLRTHELVLTPPARPTNSEPTEPTPLRLPVPGALELPDGRQLRAHFVDAAATSNPELPPDRVELDAGDLAPTLLVRYPRPGDRFRALGAPGSRRLCRFLADANVPRDERARVPLVFSGAELIWVAGLRPSHARRVRSSTTRRLRLSLE